MGKSCLATSFFRQHSPPPKASTKKIYSRLPNKKISVKPRAINCSVHTSRCPPLQARPPPTYPRLPVTVEAHTSQQGGTRQTETDARE